MSLCVLAAGSVTTLAISAFTLGWQHSVEHTGWQESWQVRGGALTLVEARVKGSGAGMDPGPGARLANGWWVWSPEAPPLPEIVLAASGATGSGWSLCHAGGCLDLGEVAGAPIRLRPCP